MCPIERVKTSRSNHLDSTSSTRETIQNKSKIVFLNSSKRFLVLFRQFVNLPQAVRQLKRTNRGRVVRPLVISRQLQGLPLRLRDLGHHLTPGESQVRSDKESCPLTVFGQLDRG